MKALKAMLGVLFIVAVVYVTYLIVPPYFNNYQLQDTIADEARINSYTQKPVEDMRETVWRKCKELDIPVTRDHINVQRDGQTVSIWIDYTVHVDVPGYPMDLKFHTASKNRPY